MIHRDVYNALRGNTRAGEEPPPHWDDLPEFVRSALLAVELYEREECAKVADAEKAVIEASPHHLRQQTIGWNSACEEIAAVIRKRK